MYQPPPGQISTTVLPGFTPKKLSVSTGWRYGSRATLAAVRLGEATASAMAERACVVLRWRRWPRRRQCEHRENGQGLAHANSLPR